MDQITLKKQIPAHIAEHFSAQKKSGLTIKAYCKEMSLSCGTFYGWRTEYLNKPAKQKAPSFKEIDFVNHRSPICDIRFSTGISVSVFRGASASDLLPVFKLLYDQESC